MLAVRLLLAAVLLASAVSKVARPRTAVAGARALGVPEPLARLSPIALPAAELGTALLLAVTPWSLAGGAAAVALMVGFTTVIAVNLARGRRPACACFGSLSADRPIGARTLVRNLVLLALAVAVLVAALLPGACTAGCYNTAGARDITIPAAAVAALAIAGGLALIHSLTLAVGRLTERVRALESAAAGAAPTGNPRDPVRPPVPSVDLQRLAPALARLQVRTAGGEAIPATATLPATGTALLLLLSADCSACVRLSRTIEDAIPEPPLSLVGLIDSIDGAHAKPRSGRLPLYADAGAVAEHIGVAAFPSAIPVDSRGEPVGPLLTGTNEIRGYLNDLVEAASARPTATQTADNRTPPDMTGASTPPTDIREGALPRA